MFPLIRRNGKQADHLADMKARIVKNEEVVLEAMGKRIKGNRCCPLLLGAPCMADACMFWQEYQNINAETGQKVVYSRCAISQGPMLQIELLRDVNLLRKELRDASAKPQS